MCASLILLCYILFVVLTTWTMTSDLSQKLNGLGSIDFGNDDNYDRCDYLHPSSNADILLSNGCDLNIVQLNIRGLISKQSRLCKETSGTNSRYKVHVFILNKTWVTKSNEHMVNIPNYTFIGKHRPNKRGGGVGLLVHEELQYRTRNDIKLNHDNDLEYQFIELKSRKRNILVGSMYRVSPNQRKRSS